MRLPKFLLLCCFSAPVLFSTSCAKTEKTEILIIGGTPGGIMTAVSAARHGHNSILVERTAIPGGLPANGLGATDISTRGATTGLFTEFTGRVKQYYTDTYGIGSKQLADCSDGYHFEPKVAQKIFAEMLEECSDRVKVLTLTQFDCSPDNLVRKGDRIKSVRLTDRTTGKSFWVEASVFIDATYEGDLGAAAGLPFRTGREAASEYGEPAAGKVYKYWGGAEDSGSEARLAKEPPLGEGSTLEADNAVQAYNFRLCITNDASNRIEFYKPDNYKRDEYVSLVEDVLTGRNTNWTMAGVTEEMMARNRAVILAGGQTTIPGDPWGIRKITNIVSEPNGKFDANNQHLAFISTDLPEENWPWPTASWEWRDSFATRLKDYTLGLLWFAANDEALPESFRKAVSEWGFAADEYPDNGGFPRQVYVREGRRFENTYFFTANDAIPVPGSVRPPVHRTSITASHYALDSHGCHKREEGRIALDGFLSVKDAPYTVPYGVILPVRVENLLTPVPVSGSHIGFSTLRMEPCWMAMGQAAGIAACLSIENGTSVQKIDISELQDKLVDDGATLIYFNDIRPGDPDFKRYQKLGLEGKITGWNAKSENKD